MKRRGDRKEATPKVPLARIGAGRKDETPLFALATEDVEWPLEDGAELLVGRSADCDAVVDAPAVSRRHARVCMRGREILVEDLGSRHGVYVNAVKITAPTIVELGDRIVLGDVIFSIVRPGARQRELQPFSSGATPVRQTEPVPVTDVGLDALAVFGSAAGRALAAGRVQQASTIGRHLHDSMIAAGPGSAEALRQMEDTSDLFAWLAVETKAEEWLDRIFELRLALRSRMPVVKMHAAAKIARDLPVPPNAARHAYLAWLRSQELSDEERAAVEELRGAGS